MEEWDLCRSNQVGSPDLLASPTQVSRKVRMGTEEESGRRMQAPAAACSHQHATLQVFTQFHTTSSEGTDQVRSPC